MGIIKHPIVEDRIIQGDGTRAADWRNCQILQQLPEFDISRVIPNQARVCLVAPHPDDEILGCGGLMQRLDALGYPVLLFAVTNGTASHPGSARYSPEQLNRIRPAETLHALQQLQLKQHIPRIELDIQDGEVSLQRELLKQRLRSHLQPDDVLLTTFLHDGHPDHEVSAQVTRQLADERQLTFIQVLIWAWHWAVPGDTRIDWTAARQFKLTEEELAAKYRAVQCFKSQIEKDPGTGQAAILPEQVLERILQPWEVYML
jgi:LmbE family N-acetylglucosaminyl deacetylase